MASSIGGAVRECPAVLDSVFGSCQLVLQSGQLVRFEGFPWVRQALQSSQSGDVCRRCIGILVLSNRLHDRFDLPCGVSFRLFTPSSGIYSTEMSDMIVESVVSCMSSDLPRSCWLWLFDLGLCLQQQQHREHRHVAMSAHPPH